MPGLDRIVGEIRKNARENLRVSLRTKGGDTACELRVAARNGRGVMAETSRGLRVPLARLGDTIAALQEAERLAIAEGHLTARS